MLPNACPKPLPRKRVKARKHRVESLVVQRVRAQVAERDGDCRLGDPALWLLFGACSGESEWAHMPERRRSKTRGMPPEHRHCTEWSLRLCSGHHARLDGRARPRINMQPMSSHGADGQLWMKCGATTYVEPPPKRSAE